MSAHAGVEDQSWPALRIDPNGHPVNVPRLALSVEEAAESLGISRDHFDRHVLPRIRPVPIGRRKLVPVRELERYLEAQASR